MEIPRQKKTVRVAVTRPSVKKGTIVACSNTAAQKRVFKRYLQPVIAIKVCGVYRGILQPKKPCRADPNLRCLARNSSQRSWGVFYLFSFLPRRETVC